jgi:hypothetical protein
MTMTIIMGQSPSSQSQAAVVNVNLLLSFLAELPPPPPPPPPSLVQLHHRPRPLLFLVIMEADFLRMMTTTKMMMMKTTEYAISLSYNHSYLPLALAAEEVYFDDDDDEDNSGARYVQNEFPFLFVLETS